MEHFVYIAKNDNGADFDANARRKLGRPNGIDAVGKLPGGFVIHHRPECNRLGTALSRDENIAEALIDLVAVCEKIKVVLDRDVAFMIHFGGQDADTCREFTRRMNEVAAKQDRISRHRFIAVSVWNECPDGFFQNGRLLPPNVETIKSVLDNWTAGTSAIRVYDHLRGIVLLCQALQNMNKEKREEIFSWCAGAKWWRSCLWGNEYHLDLERGFSKSEMQILGKNELLHDFCSALVNNPFDLKRYDDDAMLRKIVVAITGNVKNVQQ